MGLFAVIACIAFFFMVLHDFSERLPVRQRPKFLRWFLVWALKGLLVPVMIWVVLDAGVFDCFPTFSPEVEDAVAAGHHWDAICDVLTVGLFIIGSYWAALTAAWLLVALEQRADHPRQHRQTVLWWSAVLCPVALLIIHSFGWRFAGVAVTLWLLPLVQRLLTFQPEEQKLRPVYSQAMAKLHFDKHEEAEAAVLEELENCEDDFDGWLLLAELYANHFHDLAGAEDIIRQTCDHPDTTPSQLAVACHRLADWHLQVASDPIAARRALWEICRRLPKSHLDHMARLRLDQIPASKEQLVESRTPRAIPLPVRLGPSDETAGSGPVPLPRAEALARARNCVERLKRKPDDMAAREDLARLFAEQLDAVDQGLEQLELLLTLPDVPERKAAQWLSLMASWHLGFKQDQSAARKLLERVVQRYSKTPQAFAAQSRLNLLDAEAKMRSAAAKAAPPQV